MVTNKPYSSPDMFTITMVTNKSLISPDPTTTSMMVTCNSSNSQEPTPATNSTLVGLKEVESDFDFKKWDRIWEQHNKKTDEICNRLLQRLEAEEIQNSSN